MPSYFIGPFLAFSGYFIVVSALAYIPSHIAGKKGYNVVLWWFYGWAFFLIAFVHALTLPPKYGADYEYQKSAPPGQSPANELKNYKELLDTGAITQEEFEKKKKDLLGL